MRLTGAKHPDPVQSLRRDSWTTGHAERCKTLAAPIKHLGQTLAIWLARALHLRFTSRRCMKIKRARFFSVQSFTQESQTE